MQRSPKTSIGFSGRNDTQIDGLAGSLRDVDRFTPIHETGDEVRVKVNPGFDSLEREYGIVRGRNAGDFELSGVVRLAHEVIVRPGAPEFFGYQNDLDGGCRIASGIGHLAV